MTLAEVITQLAKDMDKDALSYDSSDTDGYAEGYNAGYAEGIAHALILLQGVPK